MTTNPGDFFSNFRNAVSIQTGSTLAAVAATIDPSTSAVFAQYAIRMNTSSGDVATLESVFSSAVQSGLVQTELQRALNNPTIGVLPAESVQAQRLAVAVALGLATTPSNPSLLEESYIAQCQQDAKLAREWFGVGVAFVVLFGVALLMVGVLVGYRTGARRVIDADMEAPKGKGGN